MEQSIPRSELSYAKFAEPVSNLVPASGSTLPICMKNRELSNVQSATSASTPATPSAVT